MLYLSPVAAVPCSYCYGDREREGERALEKYHNMEGVQLKKLPPPSLFSVPLPLSSLHLSISRSKLKVTLEKLLKNYEMSFLKPFTVCHVNNLEVQSEDSQIS